jgi:glycerophosphoryl diester phosphodiesterase
MMNLALIQRDLKMFWSNKSEIKDWLPRLQCHRGYWVGGLQQNSLKSIQKAYALNYKISEFDVRMTMDKQVILFHDAKYNNKFISDTFYDDLKSEFPLTTLRELLEWFAQTGGFKLNVEIKNDGVFNYEIEKKVCELIEEFQVENRILISSFNPLSLAKVRFYNSKIYRALLLSYVQEYGNNLFVMSGVGNMLCRPHLLHLRNLDFKKYKEHFKKISLKVPIVLWTVNDLSEYLENKDIIYGVISDEITPQQLN